MTLTVPAACAQKRAGARRERSGPQVARPLLSKTVRTPTAKDCLGNIDTMPNYIYHMLAQRASAAESRTSPVRPKAFDPANIAIFVIPCPVPVPALVVMRPVPVPVPDRYLNGRPEQNRGPNWQRIATHGAIHFEELIRASNMCDMYTYTSIPHHSPNSL